MVQVQVDPTSSVVQAYGVFAAGTPNVVSVADSQLLQLQQPGTKKLNPDSTIAVTPPGPLAPLPKSADQQTVAAWATSATPGVVTAGIAQAIARLLGAL